jgi:hypothetical protein
VATPYAAVSEKAAVIEKKIVDRYAHQSGVKDQLVAEREVVLTYALHALGEAKTLDLLAFKGGTCLRKVVFGSAGRFSEDLDFTLCGDDEQEALIALYEVFNRQHHGVTFSLDDEWYETDDGFGMAVRYRHGWNGSGNFRLQVSTREKPTLEVSSAGDGRPALLQGPGVRALRGAVLTAHRDGPPERSERAFQRAKVRDLYDLHLLARQKFDGELLHELVVLKLWQVRDSFDPPGFFHKLRGGEFDWDDLHRLLRPSERVQQETIIAGIEFQFHTLKDLTELEGHVVADAKKGARNEPLGIRQRAEIRRRFAGTLADTSSNSAESRCARGARDVDNSLVSGSPGWARSETAAGRRVGHGQSCILGLRLAPQASPGPNPFFLGSFARGPFVAPRDLAAPEGVPGFCFPGFP